MIKTSKKEFTLNSIIFVIVLIVGIGIGYALAPTRTQVINEVDTPIKDAIDSLTPLLYGAIGASLVSAMSSIVCLMQISRYIER